MFHLAIHPIMSWCAGSPYWSRRELKKVRTMQLRMCRNALNVWPTGDETLQMYMRRRARWSETRRCRRPMCADGVR